MSTIAIVQARLGSTRLPKKVLKPLCGRPAIEWTFQRISLCPEVERVVLATTVNSADDALAAWAHVNQIPCYRGSEEDVLERYYQAALFAGASQGDIVMRITGDCQIIDPDICAQVVRLLKSTGADYASNTQTPTFPDGLDCESMRFEALERAHLDAKLKFEREHVTQYILRHPELFHIENLRNDQDLSGMRWTLDEPEDYEFLCAVIEGIGNTDFRMKDVLRFLREHPDAAKINARFERNEGLTKSIEEESQV